MQGACHNNNGVADSEDDDSYMAYVGDGALHSSLSMAIETRWQSTLQFDTILNTRAPIPVCLGLQMMW
jgi:hypothetical protein